MLCCPPLNRWTCSCSLNSSNWSWPFTRPHEQFHGQIVTVVNCLKHPGSVRLYDKENMRFASAAEERQVMSEIKSHLHLGEGSQHASVATLALAGL
jgi:hypothetical protein